MDMVGLTLLPQTNGTYMITGILDQNDYRVIQEIQVGDTLLQIDALNVKGLPLADVVDALRGTPGQIHKLLLERNGNLLNISVPVSRLL
jgi:C-terminal processing protease CtpA/Prc